MGAQAGARVLAYPPTKLELANGLHVYVQPDPSEYVQAWTTFGSGGRGTVMFMVVLHCASDDPESVADVLDDLIDPLSDAVNVFRAIRDSPTLGIDASEFEVGAVPLLSAVGAPEDISESDASIRLYRLTLPVSVTVTRR